jgi:hypothetical protein
MSQFVSVSIKGTDEVKKLLSQLGLEADKALKITINETVRGVHKREKEEIRNVFDRPNPRTQSAPRYTTLSTSKNRHVAEVYLNYNPDGGIPPSKYLQAEIFGGKRALKRSEILLQRMGYLPPGYITRPGPHADIDQYGNMKGGQIVQILSQLRAFPEVGYRANATNPGSGKYQYFVKRGKGIFRRIRGARGAVECMMLFVRSSSYRIRFNFYDVAQKEADKIMLPNAEKALRYAIDHYR